MSRTRRVAFLEVPGAVRRPHRSERLTPLVPGLELLDRAKHDIGWFAVGIALVVDGEQQQLVIGALKHPLYASDGSGPPELGARIPRLLPAVRQPAPIGDE